MNTSRSDEKVKQWLESGKNYARKEFTTELKLSATPDVVFPQLCPSRESDWIDGWDADLIYSSTGYAEDKCVFKTNESNSVGPGLWIFTGFELNNKVKVVRIVEGKLVFDLDISLRDNHDGTTTGKWHVVLTSISDEGNKIINSMPDELPLWNDTLRSLDHYLTTGEMKKTK